MVRLDGCFDARAFTVFFSFYFSRSISLRWNENSFFFFFKFLFFLNLDWANLIRFWIFYRVFRAIPNGTVLKTENKKTKNLLFLSIAGLARYLTIIYNFIIYFFYVWSTCVQNNNWITEMVTRWMETVRIETRFVFTGICRGVGAVMWRSLCVCRHDQLPQMLHTDIVCSHAFKSVCQCVCVCTCLCWDGVWHQYPHIHRGTQANEKYVVRVCRCLLHIMVYARTVPRF